MGLKKQDYREPDPSPVSLPALHDEPASEPVQTGPTPIRGSSLSPRREAAPTETPEQREARLEAERDAAEVEKEQRQHARQTDDLLAKALQWFETGITKMHGGAPGKARDAFQKVIAAAPSEPALVARARQYIRAIENRGRRDDFVPQDADDYYLYGVLALNEGDPATALDAFEKALSQAPGDDRILYCEAAAHARRGDIDAAIEALRTAVDINDANRIYAVNDPDFVPLRVHEEFRTIVASPQE